ncbi:MAG: hypothetical protein ACP5RD_07975 [bacterium]
MKPLIVISRTYYSLFGIVKDYATKKLGFQPTGTPDDHKKLKEFYKKIAKKLDQLRNRRSKADCDEELPYDLIDNLKIYKRIVTKLDQLRIWRNKADYDEELPYDLIDNLNKIIQDVKNIIEKIKKMP